MRLGLTLRRQQRGMFSGTREKAANVRDRVSSWLLLLLINALGIAILALAIIGAPPRWRIDVLWVNKHAHMVRVALLALAVAVSVSVFLMLWRRPRGLMLALWLLAAGVAIAFFGDQVEVIYRVLRHHAW